MNLLLFPLLLLSACGSTPAGPPLTGVTAAAPGALGYDFSRPAATYPMPAELLELSGIAFSGLDVLTGVQDEAGRLYHYNLRTRRVENTLDFGPAGDYEDLARVGDAWFIIRSDGTLFRHTSSGTQRYDTGLELANNVEGLTYDAASKTLLVACKGAPGGELTATKRAIYRLSPDTYKVQTPAAFVLDIATIVAAVPVPAGAAATAQQPDKQEGKKGKKSRQRMSGGALNGFAPSAVAVHPRTGHVFVLSARPNALVELDARGRLLAAEALPTALFPQAEGLAFAPNGDLYIATEAGKKSGQAHIYRFTPRR